MNGLIFKRVAPPLSGSRKKRAIFACPYDGTEVGLLSVGVGRYQRSTWRCWICGVPWGTPGREEIAAIIEGGG